MEKSLNSFDERAKQIETRHRKLANGYVTRIDKDGVMRHKPRGKLRLFRPGFILYPLAAVLLFKGFLLSQLGAAEYDLRLNSLTEGSAVDRAGAVVMAVDPVSEAIASVLALATTAPIEAAAVETVAGE